jgi:hypothetical protein
MASCVGTAFGTSYCRKNGGKLKERRWKRSKQIQDDLKEMRGYWKMKEETLDCSCEDLAF